MFHDILALHEALTPRHAKVFANAGEVMRQGIADYVHEVQAGAFPTEAHGFSMSDEAAAALRDKER